MVHIEEFMIARTSEGYGVIITGESTDWHIVYKSGGQIFMENGYGWGHIRQIYALRNSYFHHFGDQKHHAYKYAAIRFMGQESQSTFIKEYYECVYSKYCIIDGYNKMIKGIETRRRITCTLR